MFDYFYIITVQTGVLWPPHKIRYSILNTVFDGTKRSNTVSVLFPKQTTP